MYTRVYCEACGKKYDSVVEFEQSCCFEAYSLLEPEEDLGEVKREVGRVTNSRRSVGA